MTQTTISALAVVRPFGRYAKGDLITDAQDMAAVLAGGNAGQVVRTSVPAAPQVPQTSEAAGHAAAEEH